MKIKYLAIITIIFLTACTQQNTKQNIKSLESDMIYFFQKTLEQNYGNKDAIDLFIKGMNHYHFNYILNIDKKRLEEINK